MAERGHPHDGKRWVTYDRSQRAREEHVDSRSIHDHERSNGDCRQPRTGPTSLRSAAQRDSVALCELRGRCDARARHGVTTVSVASVAPKVSSNTKPPPISRPVTVSNVPV